MIDPLDWELIYGDEVREYVEQDGVSHISDFLRSKLDKWTEVEVNIAVTGDSGTGKSSFINAIRGLRDDDEKAAQVGVTETTTVPTVYEHPTNPNISFWDLPGIGTPNYPDLERYVRRVQLEKYDAFLIFTATRFTKYDLQLAKKVRSIGKKFFLICAKIDENVRAQQRKREFSEDATLEKIRRHSLESLVDLDSDEDHDIFLISNHYPNKWDFDRLTQAILNALPVFQQESLALSLNNLTSKMLKRKADVLRRRIWMVASASAAAALVPIPGLSVAVDIGLITEEISFYRSQLGLPKEGSDEFARLTVSNQEKIRKVCLTTTTQVAAYLAAFASQSALEEFSRYIPIVGFGIASSMSFATTYYGLQHCLKQVEESALSVLNGAFEEALEDR
ncbi:interferon-inducible GTPase 5-like [Montipora capricornis]|uniref:interferon-inducible GTPase 5-like n=1 Tax=Montipora capricornis TaxID=246305 RepID=UPI0035F12139